MEEWFDTESQTPQGDVPQIEGETPAESDASGETQNGDAAQDAENVWQDDSPFAVTGLLKSCCASISTARCVSRFEMPRATQRLPP